MLVAFCVNSAFAAFSSCSTVVICAFNPRYKQLADVAEYRFGNPCVYVRNPDLLRDNACLGADKLFRIRKVELRAPFAIGQRPRF